jgi:hypothetical protein
MNEIRQLRKDLPPLPHRMQHLRLDERNYPVPYFVAWVNSKPEFRVADNEKWFKCVRNRHCWVCGDVVGNHMTFVIGPMCAVNRTTSEPPCHLDCAVFSAIACPFLTLPKAKRNERNLPDGHSEPGGIAIKRNPGVTCLWTTRSYKIFQAGNGPLFQLGEPTEVRWYTEKRIATRAEILASIDSGMPLLREMADKDEQEGRNAQAELDRYYDRMLKLLPEPT